ncbi:hypothetical protein [Amycolatopsis alkalitolerans]|uniref:Uncharacterized protein n=1 Tax=Amycolatopsis alkalitolerans TaxID=2547244 RepID=A0A5C4LQB3_9PSEU|nr:hypothetical protein [Amycolatopsis alkalitolerans]TNC19062.1 hypothetical protein FG385_32875 [Amycolatopsis alkalitolerans]
MGWSTPAIWRGPMLYAGDVGVAAGGIGAAGSWDVSSYSAVYLAMYGMTNGAKLTVQSSPDDTFTNVVDQAVYTLRQEAILHTIVPMLGNYVKPVFEVDAGLGDFAGSLWLQPINAGGGVLFPGPTEGIHATSVATTPGYHQRFWLPYVQPGAAQFLFSPSSNAYWAQIIASDEGANFNTSGPVAAWTNPASPINQTVELPPGPVWVDIWDRSASGSNAFSFGLFPAGPQ